MTRIHLLLSSALLLLLCPPASGDSQILVVPNPTTPQPNAPKARAYYPLIWHGDGDFFMSLKGVDMSQVHVRVDAEKDARELTAKAITCLKEAGIYKEPVADPALSLIVDLRTHAADPQDDSDDPKAPVIYGPSIKLYETVISERTKGPVQVDTWDFHQTSHVRNQLSSEELEQQMNALLIHFIRIYKTGNPPAK